MTALWVSLVFLILGIISLIIGAIISYKLVGKILFYFGTLITVVSTLGMIVGMKVLWLPNVEISPGYYKMVNVKEASEKYTEEVDVMAICVFESDQDIIQIAKGDDKKSIVKIDSEMFLVSNETLDTLISNQYLIPYKME